jgi:protein required for attachment to host cells
LRAEDIHRLLIIAEPQILGILRKSLTEAIPSTVQVNDLAKNLSSLSSHELHSYLLQQQLVL